MESLSLLRAVLAPRAEAVMRESHVLCAHPGGLHRMHYTEWGDPENPNVLMCVHGLTRNGRDFDFLASALCDEFRVVCPDVAGRGASDWLDDGGHYNIPQYVNDMVTLIARLGVEQLAWVGTSMGGLMGMVLASLPTTPISRLVMNDVGPVIEAEAIERIGEYVGRAPRFADVDQAEAFIRMLCASFGPLSDAQWRHITIHALRECAGGFEMRYDPRIGDAFRGEGRPGRVDLWPMFEAIACPTLVLRGTDSDLLSEETCKQMVARGRAVESADIPGVGHAPMLMDEAQIALVRGFLLG
jgi:pimeloyl-ACP methyl ester carboxylesterase